jgi:hypothetical protein
MSSFPDESKMDRGVTDDEPIRGGSIGLNRILGTFVNSALIDKKPQFSVSCISACTILRNVMSTYKDATFSQLEEAFVKDVNLYVEYYGAYLNDTLSQHNRNKKAVIIVYFPDYKKVPTDIIREHTGKSADFWKTYDLFLSRHGQHDQVGRTTQFVKSVFVPTGHATYPHVELSRKLRQITTFHDSLYSSNDPVCLISHIPFDFYLSGRIRNIRLMESYTAKTIPPPDFKYKLDKEGRIPFNSTTHVVFGDDVMIKPMAQRTLRKELFEQAVKEKWIHRDESDIRVRIAKKLGIPTSDLRRFDFT